MGLWFLCHIPDLSWPTVSLGSHHFLGLSFLLASVAYGFELKHMGSNCPYSLDSCPQWRRGLTVQRRKVCSLKISHAARKHILENTFNLKCELWRKGQSMAGRKTGILWKSTERRAQPRWRRSSDPGYCQVLTRRRPGRGLSRPGAFSDLSSFGFTLWGPRTWMSLPADDNQTPQAHTLLTLRAVWFSSLSCGALSHPLKSSLDREKLAVWLPEPHPPQPLVCLTALAPCWLLTRSN